MADTTFIDQETAIEADWLNDVNDAVYNRRGALVSNSIDQRLTGGALEAVTWDTEEYDISNIHDTSSNTNRLTVPSGVSKVRLTANLYVTSTVSDGAVIGQINKNGLTVNDTVNGCPKQQWAFGNSTSAYLNLSSAVLSVSPGDWFSVMVIETSTSSDVDVEASPSSWFSMEIIE